MKKRKVTELCIGLYLAFCGISYLTGNMQQHISPVVDQIVYTSGLFLGSLLILSAMLSTMRNVLSAKISLPILAVTALYYIVTVIYSLIVNAPGLIPVLIVGVCLTALIGMLIYFNILTIKENDEDL